MARVTTLIYRATGRKTGTSGTVTPSPTGSTVRPPLLSNANTLYAPDVNADGLILAPFTDNSQAFYGPIVSGAAVFVSPPLFANTQVFFPPTVNQTIYLPQLANEQTFGEPQILLGQSVVAPLLSDGETFYGPQVNQSVSAPLLTNAEALYGPTIVTGTSILPTPLANTQSFYGPQLNLKVTPGLLTNTQTFPGPSVASGYVIRPTTFASGQAFYAPQVNLKVISGFISNANQFYSPVISTNQLVVAPALTNSQTFYGPKLNLKVSAPLLTNTATIYSPAVIPDTAQAIAAPYHLNSQTFYGPQLNRNVKPSRLTNTNGFFTLTVSNGPSPGFALSTPSVTVISAAGDPPEITLGINSDHYAGYYLDIERSTVSTKNASDGSYVTPTLKISHQITPSEIAELEITNADLSPDGYTNPAGAYFQQYRIRREDGALSQWVEISGTVTASVAVWHGVTGVNKNQWLTTSAPFLSAYANANVGGACGVRSTTAKSGKGHFEVRIDGLRSNAGNILVGVTDAALALGPNLLPIPGNGTAPGTCIRLTRTGTTATIYRNGASQTVSVPGGVPQVSNTLIVEFDSATNAVSYYIHRGSSASLIGTVTLVNGVLAQWHGYAAGFHGDSTGTDADKWTANFGASSFAMTPTTGYSGW